jgi:nucleotide-binding universal stress UspA family protein
MRLASRLQILGSSSKTSVKAFYVIAEQESVDLIMMGSQGRTGLSTLVMGSIAQGVMRGANCPVLIVKQPTAVIDNVGKTVSSGTAH